MLFNVNTPFYYVGGAWQSCTNPEEALRLLEDNCEDYREIAMLLHDTFDHQEKQLQEKAKVIEELEQTLEKLQEDYAGLFTVCDDLEEAFTELQQTRKGSKSYSDTVKRIHSLIYDIRTSL